MLRDLEGTSDSTPRRTGAVPAAGSERECPNLRCYRHPRLVITQEVDVPLNRDYIGRSYEGERTFEVGREHIRRFAQAIGDTNPAYVDPEAAKALGHPD